MAVTVGSFVLTMAQEIDGTNCRPGTPHAMHNAYHACTPPTIRPHSLIMFFLNLTKRDPPDPKNR